MSSESVTAYAAPPTTTYRMAICLYPEVSITDYQGPAELLGCFSTKSRQKPAAQFFKSMPTCAIDIDYLSHTLEPVIPTVGPGIVPTKTYRDALSENFDIILVPGGLITPKEVDPSLMEFLKIQSPKAKYTLTVCTGSWIFAYTGLLSGKRATTNKSYYRVIVEDTKDMNIEWVPKARWVVNDDKKIWCSSGVTAGMDLAYAFLEHLVGKTSATEIRGIIELSVKEEGDDEFAEFYGLA